MRYRHELGEGLYNGLTDVFAPKPAVKKDNRVLVFVPFLKVVFIDPSAFLD